MPYTEGIGTALVRQWEVIALHCKLQNWPLPSCARIRWHITFDQDELFHLVRQRPPRQGAQLPPLVKSNSKSSDQIQLASVLAYKLTQIIAQTIFRFRCSHFPYTSCRIVFGLKLTNYKSCIHCLLLFWARYMYIHLMGYTHQLYCLQCGFCVVVIQIESGSIHLVMWVQNPD